MRRELLEEISWQPPELELVMVHHIHRRTAHVFWAELSVPLEQLQLLEGQDLALISAEELLVGAIWSSRLGSHRPLADGLLEVMQHVLTQQTLAKKPEALAPGICLLRLHVGLCLAAAVIIFRSEGFQLWAVARGPISPP